MGRKDIDCRDYPGGIKCSVALAADSDEELLEAVLRHGKTVNGDEDNSVFREILRKGMKDDTPPV